MFIRTCPLEEERAKDIQAAFCLFQNANPYILLHIKKRIISVSELVFEELPFIFEKLRKSRVGLLPRTQSESFQDLIKKSDIDAIFFKFFVKLFV